MRKNQAALDIHNPLEKYPYFSKKIRLNNMTFPATNENYLKLVQSIGETIEEARNWAVKAVNVEYLRANQGNSILNSVKKKIGA